MRLFSGILMTAAVAAALILTGGCKAANSSALPGTNTVTAPAISTGAGGVVDVSPAEASKLIRDNAANAQFVILDVRTADEFKSGHIAQAVNLDFYASDFKDQLGKLDRNRDYLVYCRTGQRSGQATQMMAGLGFKNVWNLTGGIIQWTAEGNPVVN